MASLYKQTKSVFFWIKYRDPNTDKIIRTSTGCRMDDPAQIRKAHEICAQRTLDEKFGGVGFGMGKWDTWVTEFIDGQLSDRGAERYHTAWRSLRMWLKEGHIIRPADVTYKFCCTYITWRQQPNKSQGKYKAGKNTAILEFKIFRWIMREAVKRDYCTGNPAREVVLKKEPRKEFPDLTDDQLQTIYASILDEPDQTNRVRFQRSFAISLLHAVRLNETNPNPLDDVNLDASPPTILFRQKGGRERIKPLHPQLIPLFTKLKTEKATQTYPMRLTKGRLAWSDRWTQFWKRRGFKDEIPNVCFHSLRITAENVLREAGIEQRVREFYLTHEHSTRDVNARYDRVKVREMIACHAPLNRPWLQF